MVSYPLPVFYLLRGPPKDFKTRLINGMTSPQKAKWWAWFIGPRNCCQERIFFSCLLIMFEKKDNFFSLFIFRHSSVIFNFFFFCHSIFYHFVGPSLCLKVCANSLLFSFEDSLSWIKTIKPSRLSGTSVLQGYFGDKKTTAISVLLPPLF